MRCPSCDAERPPAARFCTGCGAVLPRACTACGTEALAEAAFCHRCGSSLAAGADAMPQPLLPAATLRSERKLVTVLFADIKGSLDLIAGRDPEQADELMVSALQRMAAAIHRFGGTVNRVVGDGVMALFGAPMATEDHAVQACYAALAIREALREAEVEGVPIRVRVGLNSGEVVARVLPADTAVGYDANGEAVHVAARMEQAAEPGTVRLAVATQRLAAGFVRTRSLGPVVVRGLPQPIEAFELEDALPRRTRLLARAEQGLTPLAGREAELAALARARDEASVGEGCVLGLVAEAGCGKSRLVHEFVSGLGPEWEVHAGQAVAHGGAAYRVFTDLLEGWFGLDPRDSPDRLGERLRTGTAGLLGAEGAATSLPALLALYDAAQDEVWQSLPAGERRSRTEAACCELFLAAARRGPLALILEDAHWIDAESASLLNRLIAALPGERILLIVTARPDGLGPWTRTPRYRECRFEPLADAQARAMLRALLEPGPGVEALAGLLIGRTAGNPLFLEECLAALAEEGVLVRDGGRFRLVGRPETVRLPGTVRALLAARVDRLPEGDKDVLRAASVVGEEVPLGLLRPVAGLQEPQLQATLDRLRTGGFLRPTASFPDPSYAFRHGLTRETVYAGILRRRRCDMHGRVLDAIERRYHARLAEHVETLALHAERAEAWDKAGRYSRRAGGKAYWRDSNEEAVRYYRRGLEAAARIRDAEDRLRLSLDLRLDLRGPLFKLGRIPEVDEQLRIAEPLAQDLGDPRRLALYLVHRGHIAWLTGDQATGLKAARAAEEAAQEAGDVGLRLRARYQEALVFMARADIPACVAAMRDVLDNFYKPDGTPVLPDNAHPITALAYIVRMQADAGKFAEAQAALSDALTRAEAAESPFAWIFACIAAGYLLDRRGHPDEAIPWLERAVALCRTAEVGLMLPVAAGFLALACTRAGRTAQGLEMAETAVAEAARIGFAVQQPLRMAILARARLARGQADDAERIARQAVQMAERQSEPFSEGWARRVLAEATLAVRPDATDSARTSLAGALRLAESHGLAPLAEECRTALTTLGRTAPPIVAA